MIVNVYILPPIWCPPDYEVNLEHQLQMNDGFIIVDVNAHHSHWCSTITDDLRGIEIAEQIENSNFGIK